MMQITEDTPADMLSGAMDLSVHLPSGRTVKMSVKRSMPMMDLLMHIATIHNLQLSDHILEALSMAPGTEHKDRFIPFKPNTPIGLIDTQHVKVLQKTKPVSVKQKMAPQPFESTFRLKVHLPRNQLYVTRVSKNVLLEDILRKACEEKNLDVHKYALHHPGNLDEVLDPKLTINDYQITEVFLLAKGTVHLNQTFSSTDLMVLRKEEERKRMHAKTGGGVLSLIFGRNNNNKSSMGSGSLSSENRSISPSHSDDSRSVTPPAIQQQIITPSDKPKPPQRKRRPAPKPPTEAPNAKASSNISSDRSDVSSSDKKPDNLTICHSRNSSDSSGYHEASILSDNCNTSLPRRPQSAYINDAHHLSKMRSSSTTNLTKMSAHSKSTSSLAFPGRKKKAAPPPPPVLKSSTSVTNLVQPSPHVVVASQSTASIPTTAPKPLPRKRVGSYSRSSLTSIPDERLKSDTLSSIPDEVVPQQPKVIEIDSELVELRPKFARELFPIESNSVNSNGSDSNTNLPEQLALHHTVNSPKIEETNLKACKSLPNMVTMDEEESKELVRPPSVVALIPKSQPKLPTKFDTFGRRTIYNIGSSLLNDTDKVNDNGMQSESETSSIRSALGAFKFDDDVDIDENLFSGSVSRKTGGSKVFSHLYGIYPHEAVSDDLEGIKKWKNMEELDALSQTSLIDARNNMVVGRSFDTESLTSTNYTQATPFDSLGSCLSLSDQSVPETPKTEEAPFQSIQVNQEFIKEEKVEVPKIAEPVIETVKIEEPKVKEIKVEESKIEEVKVEEPTIEVEVPKIEEVKVEKPKVEAVKVNTKIDETDDVSLTKPVENKDIDWQYQLPPPPEGFRDTNPTFENTTTQNATIKSDSVVTSPELFEKLKVLEDNQSTQSAQSEHVIEDDKPLLNQLSLENLEKRKSLVYNRELATSLRMSDQKDGFTSSLNQFENTYEEIRNSSQSRETKYQPVKRSTSTLPNFKIATYDNPKKNITVFEDDTVRSNTNFNHHRQKVVTNLTKSAIGRSMESISFRKNSWENQSDDDKTQSYTSYRPLNSLSKNSFGPSSMHRSESFSDHHWSPSKPVSRSKSQLTLNKYKEDKVAHRNSDTMTKSNSLLDVSGLQSIGVMKLIQNRLKTPTSSMENINQPEKIIPAEPKPVEVEKPKVFQYRGPPSISLGSWSDRPKVQVTVKEDNDYKINSSKLIVNTTNNNVTSNNTTTTKYSSYNSLPNGGVNVRVSGYQPEPAKNVTIKVNGTEPISSEKSGNVIIKIGSESQRFISHTTATGYRKPLGNINKVPSQRPHSIAIDSDLSHVPVVRSVELKKPYKDMNTSITQIYQNNNGLRNGTYKSNENLSKVDSPVTRVHSFSRNLAPVVRSFQETKYSTTSPNIYTVNKPKDPITDYTTNSNVPFSQSNLRRTDSNRIQNEAKPQVHVESKLNLINKKNNYNVYAVNKPEVISAPPPPPQPKLEVKKARPRQIEPKEDPWDQHLLAIRNFGGKKGLKSVKG